MQYGDQVLVRLADPATRASLFDETALAQLIAAGYDTAATPVEGPFQAIFDEVRLGVALPRLATLEGIWGLTSGVERTEARMQLTGLGGPPLRVDALWQGAVVARTTPATGLITTVEAVWPSPGALDAAIVDDLGALPADPGAREAARRARLLAAIRAGLDQPAALSEATLDAWLQRAGVASVSELVERHRGTLHPAGVRITFEEPVAAPPTPRRFPCTVAVLARDAGFGVSELLAESRQAREQLGRLGLEPQQDPSLRVRHSLIIAWVVPLSTFDDDDWPGAPGGGSASVRRAARRNAAGAWLAGEGIGLVATSEL
jgi:hypothetical protein